MGDWSFKKDIALHTFLLQIVILALIISIYYNLKKNEKVMAIPGSISICLLGSYIGINAIANLIHDKVM